MVLCFSLSFYTSGKNTQKNSVRFFNKKRLISYDKFLGHIWDRLKVKCLWLKKRKLMSFDLLVIYNKKISKMVIQKYRCACVEWTRLFDLFKAFVKIESSHSLDKNLFSFTRAPRVLTLSYHLIFVPCGKGWNYYYYYIFADFPLLFLNNCLD